MAATTTPLVWDFYREVDGAEGLGAAVEYFTEDTQSLYLASGLKTRLAQIEEGHWSASTLGSELTISEDDFTASAWDHPLSGQLYGAAIIDGELVFLRYLYARELTQLLKDGTWRSKADSQITQVSLSLKNPGEDVVLASGTMFEPGARISVAFCMGNSRPYSVGVAFLDELDFDVQSPTFSLSGRNTIGYRLQQQTFDDETEFTGNGHEVVEWIFQRAGIVNYSIGPSTASNNWVFDPDMTFFDGLQKIFEIFVGWDMIETPAGKVVVGYPYWRQQQLANSVYQFRAGKDLIKRKTKKNADAAYANVRVTGKAADGTDLDPVYLPVETWSHWALGANKTKHVKAADGMTQQEMEDYAAQLADDLSRIGIGESFTGPPRPWLLVGDVASIITEGDESVDLGLVTSITHRFGDSGYFTEFTVDSGGVATAETRDGTVYTTRTASVNGYNRRQDLADLISRIAKIK